MKRNILISLAFISLTGAVALNATLAAQATQASQGGVQQQGNRIVVPLSHPSQPATLRVSTLSGSINVRAYNGNQIIVEGSGARVHRRDRMPPEAAGMHRLNANPDMNASEDNNVVTVKTSVFNGSSRLDIQVPVHTSLRLSTVNGDRIEVDGVTGDISVEDTNGNVVLNNVSGSIVASALNGRVTAHVTQLDEGKPSSFSSMNGTIDLTLPANVRADLSLRTAHGDIYMDNGFQFQEAPGADQEAKRGDNGMYKVRVDRTIRGTLNGGGPQVRVQNFNGDIYIRKGH